MGNGRSAIGPLSVLLGVAAMMTAGAAMRPHGLRPALLASELALASPALLALAHPSWRGAVALRAGGGRAAAAAVLSGLALWGGSLGLLELQYSVWPPPPGYLDDFHRLHQQLRPHGAADALLSLAAIALAPAVCEELLFRGLALGALLPVLRPGAAVALTAVLFGVIHVDIASGGPTLYRVPFAVAVGLALGLLRLGSGSVVPGMVAHALLNALTFTAAMQLTAPPAPPEPRPLMGAVLLVSGVAAQAWLLGWLRRGRVDGTSRRRLDSED